MSAPAEVPVPGDRNPDPRDGAVVRALLRKAHRARQDPCDFFSLVMREEHASGEMGERRRLVAAPHQRVIFEFVMAHPRCVLRIPSGFSKTYCMAALTLWLLGNDPGARGVVISATRESAAKPVAMVRDYIEQRDDAFPELRLVFPELRPSTNPADPWTQHKLTVERPPGIRDASLVAVGEDATISGSRLNWFLVDDLLSELNTATKEACLKTRRWFASTVLSRRDVKGARIVVCNTPWSPHDLTYALEKAGWPTLTMDCYGNITITNADGWDSDELRPSVEGEVLGYHRLTAHDRTDLGAPLCVRERGTGYWLRANADAANDNAAPFDLDDEVPLWPERYSLDAIDGPDGLRDLYKLEPGKFSQLYLCRVREDAEAAVKVEHVERAKQLGREMGHHRFVASYDGPNPTFLGVDLAIAKHRRSANTSFYVYELLPDGRRKILFVETGKFSGSEIVDRIKAICTAYNVTARVETNAAQDFIRQWCLDEEAALPLVAHFTGKNKAHPSYGVQSVFIALENGAWIAPCDPTGTVPKALESWFEDCLFYKPPPAHTGDVLMACWLACEQERFIAGRMGTAGRRRQRAGEVAAQLLAR